MSAYARMPHQPWSLPEAEQFHTEDDVPSKSEYNFAEVKSALDADQSLPIFRRMIANGMSPRIYFGYYGTPLSLAVEKRKNDVVELLLDHGADPNNEAGAFGTVPLFDAATNETLTPDLASADDVSTLNLLLRRGATLEGSWALQGAAAKLLPSNVRCLLQHGAVATETVDDGGFIFRLEQERPSIILETALHVATRMLLIHASKREELKDSARHVETIQALLEGGADCSAKDSIGMTALDIAKQDGLEQVTAVLRAWALREPA